MDISLSSIVRCLSFCVFLGGLLLPHTAAASICNNYANTAIKDIQRANQWKCINLIKRIQNRWSRTRSHHHKWCSHLFKHNRRAKSIVANETKQRKKDITTCIRQRCDEYAKRAYAHYAKARQVGCTKLAHYWNTTKQAHRGFCKGTTYANVQATLKRRDAKLKKCLSQRDRCGKYAKTAVKQAKRARSYRCLNIVQVARDEWSLHWKKHFHWCSNTKASMAKLKHESNNRAKQIKVCITNYCNNYATKAHAHYAKAIAYQCTKLAHYWNTTKQAHRGFCKGTTYANVQATLKRRDTKLYKCKNSRHGAPHIARYIGCFQDYPKRTFPMKKGNVTSAGQCAKRCKQSRFKYAALQNGQECYCGNRYRHGLRRPFGFCRRTCRYDKRRVCGDRWRNSVYLLK